MHFRSAHTSHNISRFNPHAVALTEEELHELVPSVFATEAHESRSDRFRPIPTIEAIRGLSKEGFSVVDAKQSIARDPGRTPFTKHLLRLRRLDKADEYTRDGCAFEILLKNANDGSAAYDLGAGFFRFVCENGLVVGEKVDGIKVRHSGDVVNKVIDGTFTVLENSARLLEAPEKWGDINLNVEEQFAFAKAAHAVRFEEVEEGAVPAIKPEQLLAVRRPEDRPNDLWTVFNRVQENVIKGGLVGRGIDADGKRLRRVRTREIKGIDQDVKVNRGLWVLAEFFASERNKLAAA